MENNKKYSMNDIENLMNQYKKEELPDCNVTFHYESEIASGFEFFIKWLRNK